MTLICAIYRSPKQEGMYLYLDKKAGLSKIPDSLLKVFGKPQLVMTLALTPNQKLARVSRDEVVNAIRRQGFFLQMPPGKEVNDNNFFISGHLTN